MLQLENTENWVVGICGGELIINAKRKAASLVLTDDKKAEFIKELKIERRKRIVFQVDDKRESWDSVIGGMFEKWCKKAAYLVA